MEQQTIDLAQARDAAESANRAKSTFLANMSHELRTPLNAIMGFSELMVGDQTLTPTQRQNLSIVNRSGEHLLELINDVLELSKIEAGRVTLQDEIFDLRQVLINLLGNAVKFTNDGQIGLSTSRIPDDQADSRCILHFEISDTGVGISERDQRVIFNAFAQADAGLLSQEGSGLGLTISREFVHLMGGDIFVSSDVGKGSIFRFDVQVMLPDQADILLTQSLDRAGVIGLVPGQPTRRLLVVEDIQESRDLLAQILAGWNFEVRIAENGEEAIRIWKEWQPHLIWMDMRMPVMDGYETTRQIKAMPEGASTAVIALTASAFEEDRTHVLNSGCDDFMRKPFRQIDIAERLEKHLGLKFEYRHRHEISEAGKPATEKMALDLTRLPYEWITDLRQAAIEADGSQIMTLAEHIREKSPDQADALIQLANQYDYQAILEEVDHLIGGDNNEQPHSE